MESVTAFQDINYILEIAINVDSFLNMLSKKQNMNQRITCDHC